MRAFDVKMVMVKVLKPILLLSNCSERNAKICHILI